MGKKELFRESKLAHKYLDGLKGLEIGASLLNPFGLNTRNVGLNIETFIEADLRDTGKTLKLDIISDSSSIPVPSESEDFIISSHVIEHSPDFIKTLVEWYRIVKKGGIIFMIVPKRTAHKTDALLPVEDWRHFFRDYRINATFDEEFENDYNLFGYYHRFTLDTFVQNVSRIFGKRMVLIDYQQKDDKVGNGFTLVFRKEISIKDAYPWKIICDDERINIPKPADFYQLYDSNKTADSIILKNNIKKRKENFIKANNIFKDKKKKNNEIEPKSKNIISVSPKEKIKTAYLIYGEDITSSGIIKNQVFPLLAELNKTDNYDITIISMIRKDFDYSPKFLNPIIKNLKENNIKLAVAKISDFNSTFEQLANFIREENIELIHCRSYISSKYALEIKKKLGISFIFDMRGLMPEEQKLFRDDKLGVDIPINGDIKYQNHKVLEENLLINADSTIALNQTFKNYLLNNYHNMKRIDVIHNFVDVKKFSFNQKSRNEIRERMEWKNKVIFVFSGSMSPWYDFSLLINWLKQIIECGLDAILLMLTYVDKSSNIQYQKSYFEKLLTENNLSKERLIIIHPEINSVRDYLSASDISVIPHKLRYEMILRVAQPIKFAEYLANGLPVLSNNLNMEIVKTNFENPFNGWILKDKKIPDEIVKSIEKYVENQKYNILDTRNMITEIARKNYNYRNVVEKYNHLYLDLLKNKNDES